MADSLYATICVSVSAFLCVCHSVICFGRLCLEKRSLFVPVFLVVSVSPFTFSPLSLFLFS